MSATWKAKVDAPIGVHQRFRLFVATDPDHWAFGGTVTARIGDEAVALYDLLAAVMPVEAGL